MMKKWSVNTTAVIRTLLMSAAALAFLVPVHGRDCYAETVSAVFEDVEENAAGASVSTASLEYEWTVKVDKGYLALRTEKAYDYANEIGELYTGDEVEILNSSDSQYWYVYAPSLNKNGYVNKDYLLYNGGSEHSYNWSVKVEKGYLALRTEKAYDAANEIGELYTGDIVEVKKISNSKYWYVYVPSLEKFGYVDKEYLKYNAGKDTETKTVSVEKGYLALRTARAYDAANEIGELYTGDEVEVLDSSGKEYWYVYAPSLNKVGYVNKDYLY